MVSGPSNGAFVLQTALGNYNVTTNSSTQYLYFPGGVCSPVGFACIAASEIVSVNMSLQTTNTLVASDIFYEDDKVQPCPKLKVWWSPPGVCQRSSAWWSCKRRRRLPDPQ